MAVSGSFDFTQNRDQLIKDSFVESGVLRPDETPESSENTYAANTLNRMLKSWYQFGLHLWILRDAVLFLELDKIKYSLGPSGDNCTESHTETAIRVAASDTDTTIECDSTTGMTAADIVGLEMDDGTMHWTTVASVTDSDTFVVDDAIDDDAAVDNVIYFYTTKIQRPLRVVHAYHRTHTTAEEKIDIEMFSLSRTEYLNLSTKNTESQPTEYYFDPQLTNAEFTTFGETASAVNTIRLVLQHPFDDMDAAADNFSFPVEWLDAIHLNLSYRLGRAYRSAEDPKVIILKRDAKDALDQAKGFDEETSDIQIIPDQQWLQP